MHMMNTYLMKLNPVRCGILGYQIPALGTCTRLASFALEPSDVFIGRLVSIEVEVI